MSTRLNALADRGDGTQSFGLTNYDNLQGDVDYLVVQGADLASAATLTITSSVHAVTGTTTVTNLNDAAGASGGQRVWLLFESALTVQHNGGGVGNIRLPGGVDMAVAANTILVFVYNASAAVWRMTGTGTGTKLDYAQITANVTGIVATTEATAVTVVTGHSVTYDGSQVKVEFWCPGVQNVASDELHFVVLRDTTVLGHFTAGIVGTGGDFNSAVKGELFDTPAAGAHTYAVNVYVRSGTGIVEAGPGGSGQNLPAFLRVTKA